MIKLFQKIFGYCEYCKRWFVYPKRFYQGTYYNDYESNYACACKDCQIDIINNWEDLKNSLH